MLKNPPSPQYELEMISLEQLVPKDHLVRKVAKAIDFEFIRDEVAHLYCQDNGRPAVDPVRLFKIMLLGYLFGIKSERQLVKEIEVNVAYRWFLEGVKASANKNKKHNEKREVRVSRYIDMLNQDVAKVREEKGKKPLKASEKAAEVKDTKVSNTASESG